MGRQEDIRRLVDGGTFTQAQAEEAANILKPVGGTLDSVDRAAKRGTEALGSYNQALSSSKGAFDNLNESAIKSTQGFGQLAKAMGSLGGNIPGVGKLFEGLGETFNKALGLGAGVFGQITDFVSGTLESVDSITSFHRDLDEANFDLAKSFGKTFEDAQYYTDRFVNNMASYSTLEFGFLSKEELAASAKQFQHIDVSIEDAMSTVRIGTKDMDLYAAAVLQAGAMNMELGQYTRALETAMAKQGLTGQQAIEQLATFSDIASKTGLNVDTVTSTLNNAASKFTKLGMSADFGRPLLEGLTNTMKDLGLGIENATGLTSDLSGALGKLTTDYATAFVVQQRSGLDFGGGGGLLGASIGLQAQMLEAEQTGDQAGMSKMLTGAMADTLRSFTGGDIVTASQAADDPSKQMAFYSQQQLLDSQFGVSDPQSQTRILDYLDRLETARSTGDEDAATLLERQIDEEIEGRDKTLGEMEKLNRQINAMLMHSRLQTRGITTMAMGMGEAGRTGVTTLYGKGLQALTKELTEMDDEANIFIQSGDASKAQSVLADPVKNIGDLLKGTLIGGDPLANIGAFNREGDRKMAPGATSSLDVQLNGGKPIVIVLQDIDGKVRGTHEIDSELEFKAGKR